ncbi:MFS transporter, partial [Candidatus Roizmanbacteria bacterium]|nr:MFS transporter [Candidatus Roizmanbacteria bacterium]
MKLDNISLFKKINKLDLRNFTTIWGGQALSIIGSDMSGFAMTLWLWDATGKATPMVFVSLLRLIAIITLVPFAGSIADRFNRKTVLIVSDAGGALVTAVTMVLLLIGEMSVTIVYVVGFLNQVFNVFHNIANEAIKVQVVPKEQLGRAAGMTSFSDSFSGVVAPVFAAALIPLIGYVGVFLIDLVSFTFAFITIFM